MADKKPDDKPAASPFAEPFKPYGKDRMASEPVVAPDGHENLSQADIDERDKSQ